MKIKKPLKKYSYKWYKEQAKRQHGDSAYFGSVTFSNKELGRGKKKSIIKSGGQNED